MAMLKEQLGLIHLEKVHLKKTKAVEPVKISDHKLVQEHSMLPQIQDVHIVEEMDAAHKNDLVA